MQGHAPRCTRIIKSIHGSSFVCFVSRVSGTVSFFVLPRNTVSVATARLGSAPAQLHVATHNSGSAS